MARNKKNNQPLAKSQRSALSEALEVLFRYVASDFEPYPPASSGFVNSIEFFRTLFGSITHFLNGEWLVVSISCSSLRELVWTVLKLLLTRETFSWILLFLLKVLVIVDG